MLRLRVNYLSSSSKSTNPPEFTSPSTYVFQCALFLLLLLCSLFNIFLLSPSSLRSTLCSPHRRRNARLLHGPTVARRKLYGHTLQLRRNFSRESSPIRASGKLEKSTSRHAQIKLEGFFGDRIIISVDFSHELLRCFSFFFSRLDRSPFPKESHDITRSIPSMKFTAKLLIPVDEAHDAQPEIGTRSFLRRVNEP